MVFGYVTGYVASIERNDERKRVEVVVTPYDPRESEYQRSRGRELDDCVFYAYATKAQEAALALEMGQWVEIYCKPRSSRSGTGGWFCEHQLISANQPHKDG